MKEDLIQPTLTRSELIELHNFVEQLSIIDQLWLSRIGAWLTKLCKQNWQSNYFSLWFNFSKLEKHHGFADVKTLLKQNKNNTILHVTFKVDKGQEFNNLMSTLCEKTRKWTMSCEILSIEADKKYAHGPLMELSEVLPNIRQLILNIDLSSYFVEQCRNLRKLRVTGKIKPETLKNILNNCHSLNELHLINDDKTLEFVVADWPAITRLGLSVQKFSNASEDILKLQYITELYIAHDEKTNTTVWIECANEVIDARFDKISSIVIGGKSLKSSEWLTDIQFDCCLCLQRLIIHNFDFLYAKEELFNLVATTPNFLNLSMLKCDNLTADVFDDMLEIEKYNMSVVIDPCPYKNFQQNRLKQQDIDAFLSMYWKLADGVNFRFLP